MRHVNGFIDVVLHYTQVYIATPVAVGNTGLVTAVISKLCSNKCIIDHHSSKAQFQFPILDDVDAAIRLTRAEHMLSLLELQEHHVPAQLQEQGLLKVTQHTIDTLGRGDGHENRKTVIIIIYMKQAFLRWSAEQNQYSHSFNCSIIEAFPSTFPVVDSETGLSVRKAASLDIYIYIFYND
jgi:hypothetical protein